jgi:asparagine synthase (glutamine-hydrolysing)
VEIRVPLLDEDVVDFAKKLPHRLKASTGKNKLVLRSLAERWLPEDISQAKKHGFGIPLDVLAAPDLRTRMKEVVTSPTARIGPFIRPEIVKHWVQLFESGLQGESALEVSREGLYQRLFFLFSLELWMQKYQLTW